MEMRDLRMAVAEQLGVERPLPADVDPSSLTRFSPTLPTELTADEAAELRQRADALAPWLQGPFLLGGDVVIGGAWRTDARWATLGAHVPADLRGRSVLDVGSNAGYDPFMFHLRGASRTVACEPFAFIQQALFLESIFQTGIEFKRIGWQQLNPDALGRFDLIHCHGVLYHEAHPIAMLQALRRMLAENGEMIFGSMLLADPELSEFTRFVPGSYYGDPTWWAVPGRLAMRWMLAATGFDVIEEFGTHDGPPGEFPVVNSYFRTKGCEPSAGLTVCRP